MKKGFTLIELLVVMILLLTVGTIIGVILFTSLRGTNKTNTITVVRQNGNFAISQMVKTIRNAKRFEGVSDDGTNYTTDCLEESSGGFVKIITPQDDQVIFSCNNLSNLIDESAVSVVGDSCYFICSQDGALSPPTIKINFTLSQYQQQGSTLLPEKTAIIPFETSVTLRNAPR
ncbi:MAG: type II secretion system protein [Candidatus Levybacteria bacterium]|nr:type II secretion system protein [Candidatus Levybacteria bacterium]